MAALFNLNVSGPPPGDLTVATLLWINLASIPTGSKLWLGSAQYAAPDKSITFNLRTNIVGQSTGTDANTTSLYSTSVAPRNGSVLVDMYRKGRLHIATVVGTGVEKLWLKLTAKGAAGSYLYSVNYTVE